MISRNEPKLKLAAEQVQAVNPMVNVQILEFNFNRAYTKEAYQKIYDKLDELKDISILVNNVGYSEREFVPYHLSEDDSIASFMNLNTIPMVYLTKYCLNLMLKRVNKRSAVIDISSGLGIIRDPRYTPYCATKSFVDTFTGCLAINPLYKDIDILNLNTLGVITQMNEGGHMFAVTSDDYAEHALQHLGHEN